MSNFVKEESERFLKSICDYDHMKHTLNVVINNNVKIIMLVGSGSNGKTHLINECEDKLTTNNYKILHDSPPLSEFSVEGFEILLQCYKQNIILSSSCDPHTQYDNFIQPDNLIILNMEHIKF